MDNTAKLAFVFPGQGSQSVGMMSALAAQYPVVESLYQEAAQVLGYDLWRLVQNGPESGLNSTEKTQPALLTASVATWKIWRQCGGPIPSVMAGHSLGEYSALVCSGVIPFRDAVALVADRGKYMQEAVPEGAGKMAALLGLSDGEVTAICRQAAQGQIVVAANFNSPGQVVIAGHSEAVQRAVELAKQSGAKRSVLLPVSVPSHCPLMLEAARKFAGRMENIPLSPGRIPVIHNVDASSRTDSNAIKQALIDQLSQPVRWVEILQKMANQGITHIVECGPSKVLSSLIKRIDRQIQTHSITEPESLALALGILKIHTNQAVSPT
jgi:malonyl CoA-acyl carrier protein transacylase